MTKFATGGIITAPTSGRSPLFYRLGQDINGHCLYALDPGDTFPFHIISSAEIKAGDYSQLDCHETRVTKEQS